MNQDQFNNQQQPYNSQGQDPYQPGQYQYSQDQQQVPNQGQYAQGQYTPGQYPPPGYPQNPYGAPQQQSNPLAVAGLVMGIISCVFPFIYFWISLIAGVLGIIFSTVAMKKGKSGLATAGLVLSIIGVAFSVIILIAAIVCLASIGNIVSNIPKY